jgi:uncharacterized membrane protein YedE/YeeE
MTMPPLSPVAATQAVLWGALAIGLLLGAAAQASRFCTMGALSDWYAYRGTARLSMWVLAVAVAATGSMVLVGAGVFDATRTLAWSDRFLWLSYPVGGALFGVGMVLASGCPQRNLVRAGAGSLKAGVTLLVAALAAQMTLRGVFAPLRVEQLDAHAVALGRPQDLGSLFGPLLGIAPATLRWGVLACVLVAVVVLLWRTRAAMERLHWVGGLVVGLLVPAAWWLTGQVGWLAEHPDTLEPAWLGTASRRPEALSFAAPLAHGLDLLTLWSDRNTVLTFGVVVSLGVLLGSAVSALLRREFRVEAFRDAADLGDHLLGGALMGFGGVTAVGCSIGQGLSGMAMLSAGACLALAGMVAGAWAALRLQTWRLERAAT